MESEIAQLSIHYIHCSKLMPEWKAAELLKQLGEFIISIIVGNLTVTIKFHFILLHPLMYIGENNA